VKRRAMLASLLGLGGCGLSQRPYLERRQWPLIVRRPTTEPARPRGRVLLVRTVRAGPGLEARGLQSLQPDGSVKVDFYEEWAVPPAQAVEDDLRQWLAASGLFAAVLAPGSRLPADLVMEGDLTAFWADLPAMRARATLGLVLLDQRPNPVKVLIQRTFTADPGLSGTDPPAIVASLRTSLAQVFAQIEAALAGVAQVA
jgi:cholesterol transport system auxiliary component